MAPQKKSVSTPRLGFLGGEGGEHSYITISMISTIK